MFSRSFPSKSKSQASFTLIELLIVIAILAVLMSVIIITINPSEMLKRTRDTRRISDLKTLNNAIQYFQASLPDDSLGTPNTVYVSIPDSSATCTNLGLPALPSGWSYHCSNSDNYRKVDGNGWIPINFTQLDIGAPISALPIDPINSTSTGNYYTYVVGGSWELTAKVESSKYKKGGEADKDGGKSSLVYETGTNLNLLPAEVLGRGSTYEELTTQESALVGYWKFDEGSGTTANDSSGNGNNGTLYNGPTWTSGKVGGALSFDGVDDYVGIPHSASLSISSKITISFWAKLNDKTTFQRIIGKTTNWGGSNNYFVGLYNNLFYWDFYGDGVRKVCNYSIASLDTSIFHYFTFVYDGNNQIIYVDGNQVKISTIGSVTLATNTTDLYFGGNTTDYKFNGTLDEVRIYNRALSDAEIKALYDATK